MIPISDLGTGTYDSYMGGLYLSGSNTPPADFAAYGRNLASQIVPLNAGGSYDANGKIGFASIGMSNASMEFGGNNDPALIPYCFITDAKADSTTAAYTGDKAHPPKVILVNGAAPKDTADNWADPNGSGWANLAAKVSKAGLTAAQIEVVWIKGAELHPQNYGEFPAHSQQLQSDMEAILRNVTAKYPNVRIAYIASRTHAYTTSLGSISPEPYAYEEGFGVQWVVQDQINRVGNINYDPAYGPVVAPYINWGPYLWADGTRSDGFNWISTDVAGDGVHPTASGVNKIARALLAFLKADPTAAPWFLRSAVNQSVTLLPPVAQRKIPQPPSNGSSRIDIPNKQCVSSDPPRQAVTTAAPSLGIRPLHSAKRDEVFDRSTTWDPGESTEGVWNWII
jgi:hypothetical protein